jgi:hypothetical protein
VVGLCLPAPLGLAAPPAGDSTASADAEPKLGENWIRLAHDQEGDVVGLETAVVRYAPRAGGRTSTAGDVSVDLIGAIHVADRAYFRQLNDLFTEYDVLLYELVAPDGTVVPRGRGTSNLHPVGAVQNSMTRMLELEHQLAEIDYTRPNFVHADMSPDQFMDSMKDRGESFVQLYFRMLGQSIGKQSQLAAEGESTEFHLLRALFAPDRARQMKRAMAVQLSEMESLFLDFGGRQGSTLIAERNKVALAALEQQLEAGKKRLGVFYGAGHLADMDERLRRDFNLEPVGVRWLTAWDLTK